MARSKKRAQPKKRPLLRILLAPFRLLGRMIRAMHRASRVAFQRDELERKSCVREDGEEKYLVIAHSYAFFLAQRVSFALMIFGMLLFVYLWCAGARYEEANGFLRVFSRVLPLGIRVPLR